jgi:hypothetical protein
MKYYLDTDFHEYKKKPLFGKAIDTIELISIGIVSEDDRNYYAISKDFDLNAAWNNEWLRENVLKPIFNEMCKWDRSSDKHSYFTYSNFKYLINKYGKAREQIAKEVKEFVRKDYLYQHADTTTQWKDRGNPQFYGYYADYHWVVFCRLFGGMIDLPDWLPDHCDDLRQELDKYDLKNKIKDLPKHTNGHTTLAYAKWNKELHKFINNL